jgi:hypothetical protein
MRFDGAVITEQGVTFAVAIVKPQVLQNLAQRAEAIGAFSGVFGGLPTILMAQDSGGIPTYAGREDLVNFMASVPLEAIPWQQYTLN